MATRFRSVGPADVEPALAVLARCHTEERALFDAAAFREWLQALARKPSAGLAWIVERDGKAVGCVILVCGTSDVRPRRAYVAALYICPRHRHLGLGDLAMGLARTVGRAQGWKVEAHHLGDQAKLPRVGPITTSTTPFPLELIRHAGYYVPSQSLSHVH